MVIINDFLYVFGGTTGYLYSTDLHRLDLSTREWTQLQPNNAPTDLPKGRWGTGLTGVRVPISTAVDLTLVYVPGTDTSWHTMVRGYTS